MIKTLKEGQYRVNMDGSTTILLQRASHLNKIIPEDYRQDRQDAFQWLWMRQ